MNVVSLLGKDGKHYPLTAKQRAMVEAFLLGPPEIRGNQTAAYRAAFNAENMSAKAIGIEACRLFARPSIALEMERQREQMAEKAGLTVEDLLAEYQKGQELAQRCEQAGAFVAATTAKAKLLGLLVEKQQVDQTVRQAEEVKPTQYSDALAKAKRA